MIGAFDKASIDAASQPLKPNQKKQNSGKDYSKMMHTLVIFNAPWNDTCYFTYSLWAKLANRFTTQKLHFIEVDVRRFEGLAKLFKVESGGFAGQLPALILFEDGREVLRFPLASDDKRSKDYSSLDASSYKEKELIKYFDLDKRHLATRGEELSINGGGNKKKAAT